METALLSAEKATVSTREGRLRLALRKHDQNNNLLGRVWLGFDELDCQRTKPILNKTKSLVFEVWMDCSHSGPIYAYLGNDPTDETYWEDDLLIELEHSDTSDDGAWSKWWARPTNSDVNKIRTQYWCAAKAKVTLCFAKAKPIYFQDGSIVSTKIELGYDSDFEQVYDDILDDMTGQHTPGHLHNPFERYINFEEIRKSSEGSPAFELYKRLMAILPQYEDVLLSILRQPSTQLTPRIEYFKFSPTELEAAIQQTNSIAVLDSVEKVERYQKYTLPTEYTAVVAEQTTNTAANHFVAYSVNKIISLMLFIKRHLEQEDEQTKQSFAKHDAVLDELYNTQLKFYRYQDQLPSTRTRSTIDIETMASPILCYDARYANLRRLTELIKGSLEYIDRSQIPFEVHAFQKVYEHWCFVKVVKALLKLEFEFADSAGLRSTLFYQHPIPNEVNCILVHPRLPGKRLEIWYDRKYATLKSHTDSYDRKRPYGVEKRSRTLNRFPSWKSRPDIVLEFHDNESTYLPAIVTLDPTLRKPRPTDDIYAQNREDKYDYLETIRSFTERDEYTGESLRLVKAAWGIWPGNLTNQTTTTMEEGDNFERGFIHLRPSDELLDQLPETLSHILRHSGFEVTV